MKAISAVNGRATGVILANPSGVTVSSGGFITCRAPITTGKPEDPGGALAAMRCARATSALKARASTPTTRTRLYPAGAHGPCEPGAPAACPWSRQKQRGRRRHGDAPGRSFPAPADPGNPAEEKPEVGSDSSALGGMPQPHITLIATERVGGEPGRHGAERGPMVITAAAASCACGTVSGGDAVLAGKGDIRLTGAAVTAAYAT